MGNVEWRNWMITAFSALTHLAMKWYISKTSLSTLRWIIQSVRRNHEKL